MSKYLVIGSYAGACYDDPEEVVNSAWIVGYADTKEKCVALAKKELDNYIDDQVESRYDDPAEVDPEEREDLENEIKVFRESFETSVFSQVDKWPDKIKMLEIGHLYLNASDYVNDLTTYVLEIGE